MAFDGLIAERVRDVLAEEQRHLFHEKLESGHNGVKVSDIRAE